MGGGGGGSGGAGGGDLYNIVPLPEQISRLLQQLPPANTFAGKQSVCFYIFPMLCQSN